MIHLHRYGRWRKTNVRPIHGDERNWTNATAQERWERTCRVCGKVKRKSVWR